MILESLKSLKSSLKSLKIHDSFKSYYRSTMVTENLLELPNDTEGTKKFLKITKLTKKP